jgi:hypothetical protein
MTRHTHRPIFYIRFSLSSSLPESNTMSVVLFVVFMILFIKLTLEYLKKCALKLQKELFVVVNRHYKLRILVSITQL